MEESSWWKISCRNEPKVTGQVAEPWEQKSLTCSCLSPSQQYNLATAIEAADAYTVFAPNNDAIESYIREKKVTTLVGISSNNPGNYFPEIQALKVFSQSTMYHVTLSSKLPCEYPLI